MNQMESKTQKEHRTRTLVISLLASIVFGLLLGVGIFFATQSIRQSESENASFRLADQGYSGNSFQKLVAPIQTQAVIAEICSQVEGSVVTILTEVEDYYGMAGWGLGSGVIFREDDKTFYIITNAHVIVDNLAVYLYTTEGDLIDANVVGMDETSDIAVVSVKKEELSTAERQKMKTVEFGDSDVLRSGEIVVTVGCPEDIAYQNSVTVGVISYPKREISLDDMQGSYIQIDAAINPGNSGGALFNEEGKVIGINSNKIVLDEVEGMGFAIPINLVKEVAEKLMREGHVQHLSLGGIEEYSFLPESMANVYQVPVGIVIYGIKPGSSAEKQGLQIGDIIIEIDGESLSGAEDVSDVLLSHKAGDTVEVKVVRGRGEVEPFTVTLVLEAEEEEKGGFWSRVPVSE